MCWFTGRGNKWKAKNEVDGDINDGKARGEYEELERSTQGDGKKWMNMTAYRHEEDSI